MATRRAFIGAGLAAGTLIAARRVAAQASDLSELTIEDASRMIRAGALSPLELTRAYLARIERIDPLINSYVTVTAEQALARARVLEQELAAGRWRGPLHGVPIALKDNIDTAGIRTSAASTLLAERVPATDAAVHQRLTEAGAVLLGKLNMHEFAYGGTSAITHFGPVRNPWNPAHIPGGSSGGSAAAVAAGLCPAAIGTDTLASIRQPAAYCGVTGLKATHGLASIRGIIPVSESLDHVGPLTRTVADSALVLDAIAGYDPLDPVSIDAAAQHFAGAVFRATRSLRIGVPRRRYFERLDADIERAVEEALRVLGTLAAGLHEIELPEPPGFSALLAEAYQWHAPYLNDPANHPLYDPATLERLLAAGAVSAEQYITERRELALARHAIDAVFDAVDLLVTPTTPALPEPILQAENPAEASGAESSVRNTYPFNIWGIPTISLPCGFSRSGLPIGLQISGRRLGELDVIALAHAYQQVTDWHLRRPPATA
jgi:aspartyl-tRNA(Asn)/glutamyl-tRNA(Gln) amidotransferase subunit A